MSEANSTSTGEVDGQVLDMTPDDQPYMRWMLMAFGGPQLLLGIAGLSTGVSNSILGVPTTGAHLFLGILMIALFVNYKRVARKTLVLEPDAILFSTRLRKIRLPMDEVKRIRLERLRFTLDREPRPFHLDFSGFTYEKNKVLKPTIATYLQEQAEKRSIPFSQV